MYDAAASVDDGNYENGDGEEEEEEFGDDNNAYYEEEDGGSIPASIFTAVAAAANAAAAAANASTAAAVAVAAAVAATAVCLCTPPLSRSASLPIRSDSPPPRYVRSSSLPPMPPQTASSERTPTTQDLSKDTDASPSRVLEYSAPTLPHSM
jgi:hypothetical protein